MVLTRLPATEKNMSTVFYSASIKIPKLWSKILQGSSKKLKSVDDVKIADQLYNSREMSVSS
jgi:hypothetical protein